MVGQKQMWTLEEETALRAGVLKHGAGKWRLILSDPKYGPALHARSNVDLKDKWRNIGATTFGSRKKARFALQNQDEDDDDDDNTSLPMVAVDNNDDGQQELVPVSPSKVDDGGQQIVPTSHANSDDEGLLTSVDTFILEAIISLKKRLGPNKKSILHHVEENMKPGMKRLVASRLKHLVNVGNIMKENNRYKISPTYTAAGVEESSPQLLLEGNKENGEEYKINGMTKEEASDAAALALEEAEFTSAEAEEAAKVAINAEEEAEAKMAYAEAVMKVLKYWMRSQTWR